MDIVGSIKTDDYELTIEEIEGYLFCHLDIFSWSTSVYKSMLLDLEQIKEALLPRTLLCNINKDEWKKIRLVEMFGFFHSHSTKTSCVMEAI